MPQVPRHGVRIEARYRVPDDQQRHLPKRQRAPTLLPLEVLPKVGDVVYLSSTSAWGVELVVHEWLSPFDLSIQVWITHVGPSHARRITGFGVTQ